MTAKAYRIKCYNQIVTAIQGKLEKFRSEHIQDDHMHHAKFLSLWQQSGEATEVH